MRISARLLPLALVAAAVVLAVLGAIWSAGVVETRSGDAVRHALVVAGYDWADVQADGLQVILTGKAPSESLRFRALSAAGEVVDPGRLRDEILVDDPDAFRPPDYSVELLRNEDGISLVGLVPEATDRAALVARLKSSVGSGSVTDLLDAADHPVPATWQSAFSFALRALEALPRSKVSVNAGRVAVEAITGSLAEKSKIEAQLRADAPRNMKLELDISAPRPVIAPFTLRFLKDKDATRFDACAADSETARDRIIAAARDAGLAGTPVCQIGLGVPSPAWGDAVTLGIAAVRDLGAATLTFSNADVSLAVPDSVPQATYDRVVGALESNLPDVFSLEATRIQSSGTKADAERPEFSADLSDTGKVTLSGRLPDTRTRDAVQNYARALFGKDNVYLTVRIDAALPGGWTVRVLAAIEALNELNTGSVAVQDKDIAIKGISGKQAASDDVSRILSERLGASARFDVAVSYDRKLDPLLGLPTPDQCVETLNAILGARKITFEPGSAVMAPDAGATLDKLAGAMKTCSDYAMEVGGHTDAQGREEMNLDLSQKRAEAVVAALMERRVLTGHLTARGYGETVPVGDNGTEAGREANRRIEFRLIEDTQDGTAAADTQDSTGPASPVDAGSEGGSDGGLVQTPDATTLHPKPNPHYPPPDTAADAPAPADGSGDAGPADGSDSTYNGSGD